MENGKRSISRRTLLLLFAAVLFCAAGLMGAVATTQAQLTFFSEEHRADIEQTHLGVALVEKTGQEALSEESPWRIVAKGEAAGTQDIDIPADKEGKLLAETAVDPEGAPTDELLVLGGDAHMVPGKTYPELVSVRNASDDMEEYVRVTVRRFWTDDAGNKLPELDPALIELDVNDGYGDAWVHSAEESTPERQVYYLKTRLLAAASEAYADPQALITGIRLSTAVAEDAFADQLKELGLAQTAETPEGSVLTTMKAHVNLFAQVDTVQTNSAVQAAKSAWGVDVEGLGLQWGREGA